MAAAPGTMLHLFHSDQKAKSETHQMKIAETVSVKLPTIAVHILTDVKGDKPRKGDKNHALGIYEGLRTAYFGKAEVHFQEWNAVDEKVVNELGAVLMKDRAATALLPVVVGVSDHGQKALMMLGQMNGIDARCVRYWGAHMPYPDMEKLNVDVLFLPAETMDETTKKKLSSTMVIPEANGVPNPFTPDSLKAAFIACQKRWQEIFTTKGIDGFSGVLFLGGPAPLPKETPASPEVWLPLPLKEVETAIKAVIENVKGQKKLFLILDGPRTDRDPNIRKTVEALFTAADVPYLYVNWKEDENIYQAALYALHSTHAAFGYVFAESSSAVTDFANCIGERTVLIEASNMNVYHKSLAAALKARGYPILTASTGEGLDKKRATQYLLPMARDVIALQLQSVLEHKHKQSLKSPVSERASL